MIDVHCHMQFGAFKNDFDQVIKKAYEKKVEVIINSSTSLESSMAAVELAQKYENLFAIIGIHPHHADKVEAGWDKELIRIAKKSKKVVGIGEIGLDYYSYSSIGIVNPQVQKQVFIRQIEIANELDLPLQIHNRQAGNDILEILNNKSSVINHRPPGMFHCMSGNVEFLKKALDLGFFIGFDGNITYEGIAKGEDTPLPDLVKNTPIEKLVVETDAPFLTPIPYRGSRNEPAHVIIVGENIARIKNLEKEAVEKITTENARKIFNLSFL